MKHIKIMSLVLGIIILSALTFSGLANATSFKTGNSITVASNETVNGMLFAAGSNIDIAGTVNGDVYCAGQTVTISGTINGDVICAGQTIIISGEIDGNIRLAGQTVTLNSTVGNSATIGAQDLIIDKRGVIKRDLLGGSQNITVNGTIGRDIVAGSENLIINGQVSRNINGGTNTLSVGSAGIIGGDVEYVGPSSPSINKGGVIMGAVTRTAPKKQTQGVSAPIGLAWFVYVILAMLLTAIILVGLFPRVFNEASSTALKKPVQTALLGIIAIILTPMVIIMLAMLAVGIPLAILITLLWVVIMILSSPFVGYLLGRLILRSATNKPVLIMSLGISILVVTYFIPIIGFITGLAAWIFGTGMILMQSRILLHRPISKKQ
jgi:hypothetical protein